MKDSSVGFNRQFKRVLIVLAVVEFIVTAFVVFRVVEK